MDGNGDRHGSIVWVGQTLKDPDKPDKPQLILLKWLIPFDYHPLLKIDATKCYPSNQISQHFWSHLLDGRNGIQFIQMLKTIYNIPQLNINDIQQNDAWTILRVLFSLSW